MNKINILLRGLYKMENAIMISFICMYKYI